MLSLVLLTALAATGPSEATATAEVAADSLSLRAAMTRALERNPGLAAIAAEARAGDARVDVTHAAWWPHLGLDYVAMRTDNPVAVFSSKLSERQFYESDFAIDGLNHPKPVTNHHLALALKSTLWDGGDRTRDLATARDGQTALAAAREGRAMTLLAEVVAAYFGVQLAEQGARVVTRSLAACDANLARAEARDAAGLATPAEVLSLRAQRSELLVRRIRSERGAALLRGQLNRLMGEPLGRELALVTSLALTDEPAPSPSDVDDLTARALARRPDLTAARATSRIKRVAADGARAWWQPRIGLTAMGQRDASTPFHKGGNSFTVMLLAHLDLTQGLTTGRGLIAEAAEAEVAARARVTEAEAAAALEVRAALIEVEAATHLVAAARDGVRAAVASRDIVASRYEAGLVDVTSLLMAETDVVNAELEELDSHFAERMSRIGLDLATGDLGTESPSLGERSTR